MDALKYLDPTVQFILFSVVKIAVVFGVTMTFVAYAVLVERKVSAWIQDRVGPNRTAPPIAEFIPVLGPFLTRLGVFQPMADGLKFLLKEDFTPSYVRTVYFWLAPAIAVIPAFLTLAVIPFGSTLGNPDNKMVIADTTSASSTRSASCRSACMASCSRATRRTRSIPSSAASAPARR